MADEKAIALDKLARVLNKLRDTGLPLNNWQAGKKYKVNYPVLHENKIYRCIEAHTASNTFDETKWETVSNADSGLKTWGENTVYKTGDIVIYGNGIYQCITEHTSTSTFDTTNWANLSVGYAKKSLYTSTTYNTASTTVTTTESMLNKDFIIIKIAYSVDGTSVKMNKSYVIAPVVGEVHDFSYQESTTSYIALTGKILNNNTLQFDFTEAQNLTKFKVISIDSLSLGIKYINENQYSTEEQLIGTWIDGKPLYQKTYSFNATIDGNAHSDIQLPSVWDKVIEITGTFCYASNPTGYVPINAHFDSTHTMFVDAWAGYLRYKGTGWTGTWPVYVTLKYTKTA